MSPPNVGTYSSIFRCAPSTMSFDVYQMSLKKKKLKAIQEYSYQTGTGWIAGPKES